MELSILALPFLVVGVVLLGRRRSRARAGSITALILALLCLGVAIVGVFAELLRGSTASGLFDRAGGAVIVFGICAIVHAVSGVVGLRSRHAGQ